jgi:NAD(P)-dependent dehydrogenase (short-subunit alcohol dehydrogenase family)
MELAQAAFPAVVDHLVRRHPMARMAREDEVVAAILWLSSEASGFVTGTPLAVDGGFLAA